MNGISLPPNYQDFLKDFILNVFENKPVDIINHAANYFKEFKESRDRKRRQQAQENLAAYGVHFTSHIYSDALDEEQLWFEISKERRKAVAGEAINPKPLSDEVHYEEKTEEQVKFLMKACREVSLLKYCTPQQIDKVIQVMFKRKVRKGEKIVTQGEKGDNFYLIGEGEFVFHIEFGDYCIKKTMSGKGSFGELALLYECPRTASVKAVTDGILWCLDQTEFKLILVNQSAARQSQFEKVLQNSKPFSMLTFEERMKLADALTERTYKDGAYIIQQSEKADCMYFVTKGQVKLTDELDRKEIVTLQIGGYFGATAMATKGVHRRNAIAVGDVTCAQLVVDDFERLLGPYRQLIQRDKAD